MSVSGNKEDP